jgi:hypothetical protein
MAFTREYIIRSFAVIGTDGTLARSVLIQQDEYFEDGSDEVYTTYFAAIMPDNSYSGLYTRKGSFWRDRLEQCGEYTARSCYFTQEELWLYHTYLNNIKPEDFNEDSFESQGWFAMDKWEHVA